MKLQYTFRGVIEIDAETYIPVEAEMDIKESEQFLAESDPNAYLDMVHQNGSFSVEIEKVE